MPMRAMGLAGRGGAAHEMTRAITHHDGGDGATLGLGLLALALLLPGACAASAGATDEQPRSTNRYGSFTLHRAFSSEMVLQAEAPTLFGTGAPGSRVTVSITHPTSPTGHATVQPDGTWLVRLAPQPASNPKAPGCMVTVDGGCGAGCVRTLADVLFGDVWVCGGQSNMEFSVAEAFDSERIVATADIPGLRLYAVQKNNSNKPVDEPIDLQYPQGWVKSSPTTVCGAEFPGLNGYDPPHNTSAYCAHHCGPSAAVPSFARATWGYFSAVCFIYGRALLRETGRPQGMLESCWGGSSIEEWSDSQTIAKCPASPGDAVVLPPADELDAPDVSDGSMVPGTHYNGMIFPFRQFPIRGAIWYQGEANAGRAAIYACQMRAMIQGWRDAWHESRHLPLPPTLANFTFIQHQLSACTYSGDVPALRWSQQGAVAPWTALPATAMTVGLDLYDQGSPCGNVHIRNKTAVGERMARAALSVTYGREVKFTGPVATTFMMTQVDAGAMLEIGFSGSTAPLRFLSIANQTLEPHFQGIELQGANGSWSQVVATVSGPASVRVKLSGLLLAVRYAWATIPRTQLLFDSTRIDAAELTGLPAPPFWANCTSLRCTLITPGTQMPAAVGPGSWNPPSPAPGPAPTPPDPERPQCPRPALPPAGGACAFTNNSRWSGGTPKQIQVPLDDYAACCSACAKDTGCHAAAMIHGAKSAGYDYCELYTELPSTLKRMGAVSDCPRLAVTLVPSE